MLWALRIGLCGPFALAFAASPTPQPVVDAWRAPPSVRVIEEPKRFTNAGVELQGTLALPVAARPVAAVVVLHGASSPLRSSPLYRHLRALLPPLGIAVFTYDRRGSGPGDTKGAVAFDLLGEDAIAAVKLLAADPRIDPKRVGVWGLSQGGWLALLATARSHDVAFAISVSAPVVTPDVQMLFSSENALRVNGYSDADIAQMRRTRKAVDDYMRGTASRATAQAEVDKARSKPWFQYLYMGTQVRDREISSWRREIEHDPLANLALIRAPTLMMYGATDPVVPVETSVRTLASFTATHPNVTVKVIADADHGMQTTVDPKRLLDPSLADAESPDAVEYFGSLAGWLVKQGLTEDVDAAVPSAR